MLQTIDNVEFKGKTVLLRVDMNVPMKNGSVDNNDRIVRSLDTINELSEKGAKVVILSHLGRPNGEGFQAEFSLKPVAKELSSLLGKEIAFCDECVGEVAKNMVKYLSNGEIIMMENVRFHKQETKNDSKFATELASLGDIFVSDAFSASHRAHASTVGIAHLLPSYAGRLMQKEVGFLESALGSNTKKPIAVVIGGAKISSKLGVLHNLIKKVNTMIVTGGMANTFLHAMGVNMQKSLHEPSMKNECLQIIQEAKELGCNLILPIDGQIAQSIDDKNIKIHDNRDLPEGFEVLDSGPQSVEIFKKVLDNSKTLLWNGPLGVFEVKPFDHATNALAQYAAILTKNNSLVSIAGGGDTVSALDKAGVYNDFTYISTAGGAFLEWIEGKELPGISVLTK